VTTLFKKILKVPADPR